MNHRKRLFISACLVLGVLEFTLTFLYRLIYNHPIPHAYTALKAESRYQNWVPQSLAIRRKLLLDNQTSLKKLGVSLYQKDYPISEAVLQGKQALAYTYEEQANRLALATKTYADRGNLPEAMASALDTVEFGTLLPWGGARGAISIGRSAEKRGMESAWDLVSRLDARTARQAAARLARIDAERWPSAEYLRQEQREIFNADYGDQATGESAKAFVEYATRFVMALEEKNRLPYQPGPPSAAPALDPVQTFQVTGSAFLDFQERCYNLDFQERCHRTYAALLHTNLVLRAYHLEHGRYPDSLESLVEAGELNTVPIDVFSPTYAPLRYRRSASGKKFTLWSVGTSAIDDSPTPDGGFCWRNEKEDSCRGLSSSYPYYWE